MASHRITLSFGGRGGCCGDDFALDMILRDRAGAAGRVEDALVISWRAVREMVGKFIVQQVTVRNVCATEYQFKTASHGT